MKRNKTLKRLSGMQGNSCLIVLAVLAVGFILWALVLPGLWPMSWLLYSLYANPIAWLILIGTLAASLGLGVKIPPAAPVVLVAGVVVFGVWLFLAEPVMLIGLYARTDYVPVAEPFPLVASRPVAYAEANENFSNQNPDTRFAPGDLDYIQGRWVAEFGPNNGLDIINKLIYPSQGFFVYDPTSVDKVQIVRQEMPFAESGLLFNSAGFYVRQHDVFTEFHEVLYVSDGQTGYQAVISLIKRSGWRRVPYVAQIGVIHPDGTAEWLTPAQAEADPRLQGVQIEPEWLAAKKTLAYGWRNGLFAGLVTRQGRVSVQRSSINAENSAPYHLESNQGMLWYTPYGPYRKDSLKGIMIASSSDIDGPVYVWELPGDQAYQGVDALATEIKAAPNHPADVNWLRVSQGEDSEVRSGDTDVIELLPAPRQEGDKVTLYFTGFVAIDPPTRTRFYVIINAETREVLEDVYAAEQVNAWLRGEIEIPEQRKRTTGGAPQGPGDLSGLSDAELLDLLQAITDELRRR